MRRFIRLAVVAAVVCNRLFSESSFAFAQAPVDAGLARYINGIRAIDNHAHPMRPVVAGAPADSEFDALPLDGIPPFDPPNRLKPDDPIWRAAQNALYHISPDLSGAAYHSALKAAVAKAQRGARGQTFPTWALDQAGIEIMMANRIVMGPGLVAPRFRWIAFADPLLLPARHARRGSPHARHEAALSARSQASQALSAPTSRSRRCRRRSTTMYEPW